MNKKHLSFLILLLLFLVGNRAAQAGRMEGAVDVSNLNLSLALPLLSMASGDTTMLTSAQLEAKADALLHEVKTSNKYIGVLAANQAHELPVALRKDIAGVEYTIVLDDLYLDPLGAGLKAYMTILFPGSTEKLGFFADNVRIGPNGIETAQLRLIRDRDIRLGSFTLRFRSDVTRVDWDCNGYHSTTIGGDVIFPSSLIKPAGGAAGDSVSMGSFFANFTDFNDLILGFGMEPFEVNGLPDFQFHPGNVYVDISDLRNPQGTVFPAGFFPVGQGMHLNSLWRGLVIPEFTVRLPEGFNQSNSAPIEIGAQHMLIDANGITGQLFAANILSLEQGDLGGWGFSMDTLGFTFFKNSFSGFKLTGEIKVPISDEQRGFRYSGTLDSQANITFAVASTSAMQANLWGAQLLLEPNSSIQIMKVGNTYKPFAMLHGQMSIALGSEVTLGTFAFQNMVISTDAPYLSIGSCSFPNGLLAGFPVNVSNMSFVQNGDLVGLSMQANVSFMSSDSSGFGGSGGFTIWAERIFAEGRTRYQYKETTVSGIAINVNQGGFKLNGSVAFYQEHAVFGKGFRGMLNATFLPGFGVDASAQFGTVNGFRYWYVDAMVSKSSGIPVLSGFAVYGFGGGLSYRMRQVEPASYAIPLGNHTSTDNSDLPGVIFSGAQYVPDATYGLGLKASVILGTHPSPKAMNGQVSFRIQFYAGGGVQSVRFQGDACLASELRTPPGSVPVRLTMDISYNFSTQDLYGVNEAFVDVAGMMKGIHAQNKAGTVVFRFNPTEWFVHMGTPNSRIGLRVLDIMTFSSYFMVGTNIPAFPAPPQNVAQLLAGTNVQSFEGGLMSTGSGFAFGSAFNMDTGEKSFLIFYGAFSMGTGFDIMLKDYGSTAYCQGFSPPLGINGWYAMGQAYAYMAGKIGVNFKLFGRDKKMDILSVSAAALLQAKLPNPVFFKGQAGGHYNILGGLVKGQCNFEFSVGNNCVVEGANPLGNISVIADMAPASGNTNVSVFVSPQVAFNMPVNAPFEIVNEQNQTQTFRIKLDYLKVMAGAIPISGQIKWNQANDVATFETQEIYPALSPIDFKVRVIFQRYHNGQWVDHLINGQLQKEEQTVVFTTGERPDHIPANCVEYVYPVAGMMNFHWREHNTGYIKLTHDFSYLLADEPDWQGVVQFEGPTTLQVPYQYNNSSFRIQFPIPANLSAQMAYSIRLSKIPLSAPSAVDANVDKSLAIQTQEVELTETTIEGEREVGLERILYQMKVRTSMYATFGAKLDAMQLTGSTMQIVTTGIHNVVKFAALPERLDGAELLGDVNKRLIRMDINLDNNVWFNDYIKPLVYQGYPRRPELTLSWRDVNVFGIPPFKAVECYQSASMSTVDNLTVGQNFVYPAASIGMMFSGVVVMNQDYQDLKGKAAALYNPSSPHAALYLHLINGFFMPIFTNQQYQSTLRYVLPGENIVTTERVITFDI